MTVRVATVLSAREWEPKLVALSRDSASLRVVLRAFQPEDVDAHVADIDVVVVGGEVSWATPGVIASWRTAGLGVVGVTPAGDAPAKRILEAGGCDEVVPDTIDTVALIQAVRFAAPRGPIAHTPSTGHVTAIVGPRGAPGCTEVAISYAMNAARLGNSTVLLDLDLDAPSMAIRLGLQPRPDLVDAAEAAASGSGIDESHTHRVGSLAVITGVHRTERTTVRRADVDAVIRSAVGIWDEIVIDVGTTRHPSWERAPDDMILVAEATAVGIVRAAERVADWWGPTPALVLNRVTPGDRNQAITAARRWTGLDPAVTIPDRRQVRRATARASLPDRRFVHEVARLRVPA